MTSFMAQLAGLDGRISATAALPPAQQGEALAVLFQETERDELPSFVALLIGEVVSLRERLPRPRSSVAAPNPPA